MLYRQITPVLNQLGTTVWACLQWQFTAYYLQAACLFRLTFSARSDSDYEKVRSRKRCLAILEISVYAVLLLILAVYAYLVKMKSGLHPTSWICFLFSDGLYNLISLAFTSTTILSARHIHLNS